MLGLTRASLCRGEARRAGWTGEVSTENKTFEPVFQQITFQVEKASRGHEQRACGCEPWPHGPGFSAGP